MERKNMDGLSLRNRLGIELMDAFNMINEKSQQFFSEFDITPQQYNVLAILQIVGAPMSTSDILQWMIEKNAGVSRLVDRLVKKGLVIKKANEIDKRLINILLTQEGENLCKIIEQQIGRLEESFSELVDKEVEQLIALLVKLTSKKYKK